MPKLRSICTACGKEFFRYPSQMARVMYCSKQCHQIATNKQVTILCKTCGKAFLVSPSVKAQNRNYCSKACYKLDPIMTKALRERKYPAKVEITCKHCGRHRFLPPSIACNQQYCSNACRYAEHSKKISGPKSKRWRGILPHHYKTLAWRNLSRKIIRCDHHICQHCTKTKGRMEAHHKIPWVVSMDDSPENLTCLCPLCHHRAEDAYWYEHPVVQLALLR